MSSWGTAAFTDVVKDVSGGNVKLPQRDYLQEGIVPIVDQGRELIGGYTDDLSTRCKAELPVVVFGDHTRALKLVDFPFAMGADGVKVLKPCDTLDERFLYHYLRLVDIPSAGYDRHFKYLKQLEVPLPPIGEQQRIAAILDHADALRAKRCEALARLDELTRSIFIDMFGHPAFNSKGLQTVSLGELGKWQSGGTPPRTSKSYFEGNIPWFSSGELNEMYVSVSHEQLTEAAIKETSAKAVPAGSLLLGMYDTAALKSSIATKDCSCNQAIAFASINPDAASTPYVYFAVAVGRDEFRRVQRGVRQKNLNLSMVKGIRIPSPPLAHQRAFEAHVGLVLDERVKHHTALTELDALFSSLQARAFRGEL